MKTAPRMTWIALAALVVFANALGVVYSAARNRELFMQKTHLGAQHDHLVVLRGQLALEEWTLAAHARVAHLAATKLDMQEPDKVKIVEVRQ